MTIPADHGSPESAAGRLADARVSEFNHRLEGFILFLASIFVLAEESLAKRWSSASYVWPMCLLAAGMFVLALVPQRFGLLVLRHHGMHLATVSRIFNTKVLLQFFLRWGTSGDSRKFCLLCFSQSLPLRGQSCWLFHVHGGDMSAPDAAKIMRHIENQHRWFAATGLGIAVTKGLAEIPQRWQQVLKRTWPVLLIILGILLMAYTERVH
jgi:hypothetical protein